MTNTELFRAIAVAAIAIGGPLFFIALPYVPLILGQTP